MLALAFLAVCLDQIIYFVLIDFWSLLELLGGNEWISTTPLAHGKILHTPLQAKTFIVELFIQILKINQTKNFARSCLWLVEFYYKKPYGIIFAKFCIRILELCYGYTAASQIRTYKSYLQK